MNIIEVIKPGFLIKTPINRKKILETIEEFGRVSHKSEDKIASGTDEQFVRKLLGWGHESVLEHIAISVLIICDRGITHELVRHRLAAYTQESTRYCDYSGKIQFIKPLFFEKGTQEYKIWYESCKQAAKSYQKLRKMGKSPEQTRSVLPNSLKTEIVATYNLREWRHVFEMRCQKAAHPQMREIMIPLLQNFQKRIHPLFDDFTFYQDNSISFPLCAIKDNQFWQKK
jgi:thymidylate synthase (FAD)